MTIKVIDFGKDSGTKSERRLADLPDRVVEGDPHHQTTVFYENKEGRFMAGTWVSTPGKWRAFTDRDEFCYFISGHARLISEDGTAQTFKTGDAFLIPNGFRGYWEVLETTTKHFVIREYDPK